MPAQSGRVKPEIEIDVNSYGMVNYTTEQRKADKAMRAAEKAYHKQLGLSLIHIWEAGDRMYFTVTADGKPLRQRRYCFSEGFYAIANAEYYGVTGEKECIERARRAYELIYQLNNGLIKDPTGKMCIRDSPCRVPPHRD